jgi:hypothetical protein
MNSEAAFSRDEEKIDNQSGNPTSFLQATYSSAQTVKRPSGFR